MAIFHSKDLRITVYTLRFMQFPVFLMALLPFNLLAAETEQRVPSNITNVTVFLNQAQVTRLAKVSLTGGVTHLVFDRISPYINLNSIQVKTDPSISLLSVSQRNNFLLREEKPAFITDLEDTLEAIRNQAALIRIKREALQLEREVIISNRQIGGTSSGVKIEDLEDALTLFRKRSQEIGEELLKLQTAEKKILTIQRKLQSQLDAHLNNRNSSLEIVVTVKTLGPVNNAKIEWSYMVSNASWVPFYDIRVKDTKSPLQLVSKAYITQATGEDWNNVILKLSTTNPNESGTKPELTPVFIQDQTPVVYKKGKNYPTAVAGSATLQFTPQTTYLADANDADAAPPTEEEEVARLEEAIQMEELQKAEAQMAEAQQAEYFAATAWQAPVNMEFNVTSAYSIPADNNPHQVDLTITTLNATYAYGAVPKLDKDVFVTARVSGNDLVSQVNGEANVYFDGTFTGKTYVNGTSGDSLLLSLGRDRRVQVQRTQLKDFSSKSLSGSSKKELNTWEISLRNTSKEPVTIIVEDQIPVSSNKDINVKLLTSGGATHNDENGKLTWTLTIEPEKSQVLRYSFEVKYPKDRMISQY